MGLFGSSKAPRIVIPDAPKFKQAEEVFQNALDFNQRVNPLALGAREGALEDIARGNEFFQEFQPTTFEEALANQTFQNILPDVERSIRHNLSLSGIESSPVLAEQVAKARGDIGVDIGRILADLGNQRALNSLQSRFSLDPNAILSPFAQADFTQSNLQDVTQFERDKLQAQADFQNQMADFQSKKAGIGSIGSLLGGGLGFLAGGPGGAAIGASLGGSAASLFGGGQAPISLADALDINELVNPATRRGFGKNAPRDAINTGNMSFIPSLANKSQAGQFVFLG